MPRPTRKSSDNHYHVNGKAYPILKGSRAQVWHETAYKTTGGLTKTQLHYNSKTGRIVSKKKHKTAKRDRVLSKLGYNPVKGIPFRPMKKNARRSRVGRRRH